MPWLDVPVADVVRAAHSVISQDYEGHVELLICSDGSEPAALTRLQLALAALPWGKRRYRIHRHDSTRGVSAARNTAARHADTDWLLWLDSDDELAPGAIRALMAAATRSRAGLVSAQCLVDEGERMLLRQPERYLTLARAYQGTVHDPLAQVVFSLHPQVVRREAFELLGRFDPSYRWAEVTELFLRFVRRHSLDAIELVPRPLYRYYRRPASLSTNRERMTAARREVLLAHARAQGLPIDDLRSLGRCENTGAQHFLPIVAGEPAPPPYVERRAGAMHLVADSRTLPAAREPWHTPPVPWTANL